MNIYIDFDRTLYDTDKLYMDMLDILNRYNLNKEIIEKYKKAYFEEPVLFNIFKLMEYICNTLKISKNMIFELKNIINNGSNYIYKDVYKFLSLLKQKGYKINVLTYGDLDFQISKIAGLTLNDYIDTIIITKTYKYEIDIEYENSIFIDDNPRDLIGLYKNHSKKVIRIRRKKSKYYNKELNINEIDSFSSLKEIDIDKF